MRHEQQGPFERAIQQLHSRHHHRHGRLAALLRDEAEPVSSRGRQRAFEVTSAELQLLALSLLSERAQCGYEMIETVKERSKGAYSPAPGLVYPELMFLEEVGRVTATVDGPRKTYRTTDAGRAYLAEHQSQVDATLLHIEQIEQKMSRRRHAFGDGRFSRRGDRHSRGEHDEPSDLLRNARVELKEALIQARELPIDEQHRVVEILGRAAREIRSHHRSES